MSFRVLLGGLILGGSVLFFACGSDSTTGTSNPRTITVIVRNLESISSVHVYFDLEEPSEENLVSPQDSIIAQVSANKIGQSVTVYVAEGDKPEPFPFYSRSVRVTQTSWDSREAELQWTGAEIVPLGW